MTIDIERRTARRTSTVLMIIGPGGSGKSSVGLELAPLIGHDLIDLDTEFTRRNGNIGSYIWKHGYIAYKIANSRLAHHVVDGIGAPTLLVASSGFLTVDNPARTLSANRRLMAVCFSICLLPSRDLEKSVRIIVERQLTRPFTSGRTREEATIRRRWPEYAPMGDLGVFSIALSRAIARAIVHHMSDTGRGC